MKYAAILLLLAGFASAQTTRTTCTQNRGQTTCESGPDPYEQLGRALAVRHEQNQIEKFCRNNPGQIYKGHQCPSEDERIEQVAAQWRDKHPKFRQCPENAKAMLDYMDAHGLDLAVYKSYDIAFKALKKAGQIVFNQ